MIQFPSFYFSIENRALDFSLFEIMKNVFGAEDDRINIVYQKSIQRLFVLERLRSNSLIQENHPKSNQNFMIKVYFQEVIFSFGDLKKCY